MELYDSLKFDEKGLVTAVVQDDATSAVLMVAHMNREAVQHTLETGRVTYWSRSRQKLWVKGGTSGQFQILRSMAVDCDGDALLVRVEQTGAACHEGYRSCFFRRVGPGRTLEVEGKPLFDPREVYGK